MARTGLALGLTLIAVAACTSSGGNTAPNSSGPAGATDATPSAGPSTVGSSQTPVAAAAAVITTLPAVGAKTVSPGRPITATVANGKFTSVVLTNPFGKKVKGAVSADGETWSTSEALGYSRTYKLSATATNADGKAVVKHGTFKTVTPNNMTQPTLSTIYGTNMENGATYGVGMIVVVRFDEQIPDKKAAMAAMQVTTSPHVDGAWYWTDGATAHWRPESFYAPGTKVTVDAKVYGTNLGNGLYGQSDQSTSFTVGARHVAIANGQTHHVKVYFDGKMVRDMPTSMGRGGYVQGTSGPISLWTPNGYYTVIGHENPAHMSSASYGLPATSTDGYKALVVPWATKISTDGIYLHELDSTVWAQGHENRSHGCLNLNYTNAKWYFQTARLGDVVQVVKGGGQGVTVGQGGDWSLSWKKWKQGNV